MKKKLFAMLLTAALVAAQGVTAFAADSATAGGKIEDPSGNVVIGSPNAEVVIDSVDADTVVSNYPAEVQETVKTQLEAAANNSAAEIISTMGATEQTALSGSKVVTAAFDVTSAEKEIQLYVPTVPENASVFALHLKADGQWELIPAERNGEYITLYSESGWSPVVLVYKEEAKVPEQPNQPQQPQKPQQPNQPQKPAQSTRGDQQKPKFQPESHSSSSSNENAVFVTSPQTGVASDWSLWMGAAFVLLAAASVMFRKKEA